jgi:uncharacterized membrane protein YfcA
MRLKEIRGENMKAIILAVTFIITWIISALFAIAGVGAANTLIPIYYSLGIPYLNRCSGRTSIIMYSHYRLPR